jgi:hypothetical protein
MFTSFDPLLIVICTFPGILLQDEFEEPVPGSVLSCQVADPKHLEKNWKSGTC